MSEALELVQEPRSRRFRRYPEYRNSGVEWPGEIPAHWDVRRLKLLLKQPLQYGANEPAELSDVTCPRYIRITDIREDGMLRSETFRSIPEEVAAPYLLEPGDLLFARSGATVGKTFRFEPSWGRAAYAGYLIRARLEPKKADSRFVLYYTVSSAYWDWLRSNFIQATIQNVSADRYANLDIPVPAVREQHGIAAFLDRETAKIDALVAKKERLIELLQEKRTALITSAVTRGLDPNVPMKDSGVEWLGEIPAHWEVKRWRYCCRIKEGLVDPTDATYCDREMIAPNHVESGTGRILFTETADEQGAISGKYLVRPGDLIYSKIRPVLNKVCIAEGDWLCSADMYPVEVMDEELSPQFLVYFMLSAAFVKLMVDESMRVAMPKVNREKLSACPLLLPPREEQELIVNQLQTETAKIDALAAKVREAIDRLKEFRTALISTAVTGKIDVREETG
jgi:type I restriction enzyme S subunit